MDTKQLLKQWGIGLTGGIACGKSTIAAILREQGYTVLDADALSRQVVASGTEGLREIIRQFGTGLLDVTGAMDRSKMRQLVFSDPEARKRLEKIIHPRLEAEVAKELLTRGFASQPRLWFYEASLIYERQRAADFRQIWVAFCPESVQVERVMQRDRCSKELALSILASQMPAQDKAAKADLVIHTDCPLEELQSSVKAALARL